jgi:hypothetical protein
MLVGDINIIRKHKEQLLIVHMFVVVQVDKIKQIERGILIGYREV